jgi:hypothetical protein
MDREHKLRASIQDWVEMIPLLGQESLSTLHDVEHHY